MNDGVMPKQKFTIPDTHGYQAITFGNAKEALTLVLEDEQGPVPPNIHPSHIIITDYAARKRMSIEETERWLAPNLAYQP